MYCREEVHDQGEGLVEHVPVVEELLQAGPEEDSTGQHRPIAQQALNFAAVGPSDRELPVERYVTPEEFAALAAKGGEMGFLGVYAGPFVRSSYNADSVYKHVEQYRDRGSLRRRRR